MQDIVVSGLIFEPVIRYYYNQRGKRIYIFLGKGELHQWEEIIQVGKALKKRLGPTKLM